MHGDERQQNAKYFKLRIDCDQSCSESKSFVSLGEMTVRKRNFSFPIPQKRNCNIICVLLVVSYLCTKIKLHK